MSWHRSLLKIMEDHPHNIVSLKFQHIRIFLSASDCAGFGRAVNAPFRLLSWRSHHKTRLRDNCYPMTHLLWWQENDCVRKYVPSSVRRGITPNSMFTRHSSRRFGFRSPAFISYRTLLPPIRQRSNFHSDIFWALTDWKFRRRSTRKNKTALSQQKLRQRFEPPIALTAFLRKIIRILISDHSASKHINQMMASE